MAITIRHPFVSAKGDGGDATLVRPSNWNANHTTSMDTLRLLGRSSPGVGSFEELPTSAYVIAALAAVDKAALIAALGIGVFETGDVKFSIDPAAPAGWIVYQGTATIGKSGSAATARANDDTWALYNLVYTNITDAWAAVSGGRTGNALNDFNALKTIAMPWFSGRAIIGAGGGGALTTRTLGQYGGAETHFLTVAELAQHQHANSLNDPSHNHTHPVYDGGSLNAGGGFGGARTESFTGSSFTGMSINNAFAGSGAAHNNMQPYIPMWTKVKL